MEQTSQLDQVADGLRDAVMQAAIDRAMPADDIEVPRFVPANLEGEKSEQKQKKGGVSPLTGQPTPPGRPKGVRNKLTNLRDAVIEAFDTVGGPQYLVELAKGTQSDRAAFVSLVSKVLPTQINASVDGGIQVQLSWLGNRNIGAVAAQPAEVVTQVIDLQRDNGGKYRIIDQPTQPAGAGQGPAAGIDGQAGQGAASGTTAQNDAGAAQGE